MVWSLRLSARNSRILRRKEKEYDTVRYEIVSFRTVWYDTIQYNTIRYDTMRYGTVLYDTIWYNTILYRTTLYDTMVSMVMVPYDLIRYDATPYDAILLCIHIYDTIQYDIGYDMKPPPQRDNKVGLTHLTAHTVKIAKQTETNRCRERVFEKMKKINTNNVTNEEHIEEQAFKPDVEVQI